MDPKAVPFDTDAVASRRAIIRRNPDKPQEIEMIEAAWGSAPRFSDGVTYEFIRAEGKRFPTNRCLVAASEFHVRNSEKKFRAFREDGNFFYLAAIWEPALGDWPISYRIITVDANTEIIRYQGRHGAMIERRDAQKWLSHAAPEEELIVTPPFGTFLVEEIPTVPRQSSLAL